MRKPVFLGRKGSLLTALLLVAGLLCASVASATVMLYADLARLVELSDIIVQGRVVDQDTFFDEETDHITTITTFEVDRAFHGKVGETVKFSQWGGEWNDRTARIPGDAQFAPYEEAIIFLDEGEDKFAGMNYLVALGQSKYTIVRSGDQAIAIRALGDLAFLDQEENHIEPRKDERRTLDSLVAELETLVAGIKGGSQ